MSSTPLIIDGHTHSYPPGIADDPQEWALDNNEPHWAALHASPIQGWSDPTQFIADMDDAGIAKSVLLGWYWENQDSCRQQIEWHGEVLKSHADCFITFAPVQPRDGLDCLDDLKRALDLGAQGIGELFPATQGYTFDDPTFLSVVEFAIQNDLPISMHVTEPVGRDYPGKVLSPLGDYVWLAKEYPELKLILAHWGGLLPFYELNESIRESFKNVYYDTSASPLLYDKAIFNTVLSVVSPKKIIYGSDYPLRLYPKQQKTPGFKLFLDEIKSVVKEEALEQILSQNLLTILPKRS